MIIVMMMIIIIIIIISLKLGKEIEKDLLCSP